jgi:hypothetical protein
VQILLLSRQSPGHDASFAQRDFAEANEDYALVNMGWAYFLVSLQQYLERGKGAPHPDVDFTRMIG